MVKESVFLVASTLIRVFVVLVAVSGAGTASAQEPEQPSEREESLALQKVEEGFYRDSTDILGERWDS